MQLNRIASPDPARSFLLDLCLAASILCAWFALQGFEPLIAAAAEELRLVVTTSEWQLQWPPGPWAIAVLALALAWIRDRFLAAPPLLQERLQRFTLLAALLLVLRLAALWDPLTYIFPFLTLLWSPHALWGLVLAFLAYVHLLPSDARSSNRASLYTAAMLFALCLPLYFLYTLYFCQVTMLHGDEGQYLRVTQSLLHDGDMDLANNLDTAQTNEFHVVAFGIHKAPGSPEGKVHSVHPIGLSIALLPAYEWGLVHWQNPRLASALFMALLATLCVPLVFLWLVRIGTGYQGALLATLTMALTGPFFLFTNQLFPEVPALFIGLCALWALAHWQVPGGSYRSWRQWEVPALGLLTLLLCCLPFLHARYTPIGLLCGAGVLLQAWHSPKRNIALGVIALIVALGLYALLAFHYAFSDDWMGPFRPGNAWEEGALDIATWSISLPGHWLHVSKGILNSSPIFFFALFGWAALARLRDRRLLVAIAFYGATAATNGMHPDWGFGFCFPARFLVTALPVLVYGLALAWPLLLRSATTAFFAAMALVISLETVLNTLVLTETGYDGRNLLGRSINNFYPLHQHFFPPAQEATPLFDLGFWLLLAAALFLGQIYFGPAQRHQRLATALVAALLPFLWGRSDTLVARLPLQSLSPYMARLAPDAPTDEPPPLKFEVPLRSMTDEALQADGSLYAHPDSTPATLINSSLFSIPLLQIPHPGLYQLSFSGLSVKAPEGQVAGHLSISQGYTVQAVSFWASRSSYPLLGGKADNGYKIIFQVDRPSVHYIYGEYSGHGELSMRQISATFIPIEVEPKVTEIHRFEHEPGEAGPVMAAAHFPNLPRGHYRVRFSAHGSTFASFFDRLPAPIKTAAYAGPVDPDKLRSMAFQWFTMDRYNWTTVNSPEYVRPLVEGIHPPWWLSIPFAESRACELRFILPQQQDVWFLLHYEGPEAIDLSDIVLYREDFDNL